MSIISRIKQFIDHKDMSMRSFENTVNAGHGYFSRMLKQDSNPGSEIISTIIETYPEINAYWLLLGDGEMLIAENNMVNEDGEAYNHTAKQLEDLIGNIADKKVKKLIAVQNQKIDDLAKAILDIKYKLEDRVKEG